MSAPVLVRDCDGCTLCCKVMGIEELGKPTNTWCGHCLKGKGCGFYEHRPTSCREFNCVYLTNPNLGPEWRPADAKFVIRHEGGGGGRIAIHVDTQRPDAWRREPFLSTFHAWAEVGARHMGQVVVYVGRHVHVIVPDRVVDLGEIAPDELILTTMIQTPQGVRLEPFKAGPGDPRYAEFLAAQGKPRAGFGP
ncbi:MAG TPA: YkgJ family cysteine cluster protein [Rhizomicrobium sp.]|jgi:hypothetical protein|nr:YkgJ family cysteine cluster protein [Rhizomicrobium sp.]